MKDTYKLLGLSRGASQDDIEQAHRKLVREYHPDANPEDPQAEERFKEIQQAYEILSNPEKRREYDKGLHTSSKEDTRRSHARARRRTGAGTTHTSSERAKSSRGPLFWLGYLLGIALVALVIASLVILVIGID